MRMSSNSMDNTTLLLMDELWQKSSKSKKNNTIDDLMFSGTSTSKSTLPKPNWDMIPSKGTAMSEEEFEEAIKALAFKTAEKGMAMGDIGKAKEAFRTEEKKLLYKYISVASPDRKAAYENYKGTSYDSSNYATIGGNFNQKLMIYTNGAWGTGVLTADELSRGSKFYEIYQNAMKEYEAENGKFSDAEKSKSVNPYNEPAEYKSYNLLNQLV